MCSIDNGFLEFNANPREGLVCVSCGSVPRHRAAVHVLESSSASIFRNVHEIAPSLCTYYYLREKSKSYQGSYYWEGGRHKIGVFRNVNIEDGPFGPNLSLVVALDVLEHVFEPSLVISNVMQSLAEGGVFFFTVPVDKENPTVPRAVRGEGGRVSYLLPPDYHRDPSSRSGSLVVTDWGADAVHLFSSYANRKCVEQRVVSSGEGIPESCSVFYVVK